jgi:anti-sigma regulatory factor (Ser/Thr protein kinase)
VCFNHVVPLFICHDDSFYGLFGRRAFLGIARTYHLLVADARQLGVSDEDSRRLQLIAEELFTNTVAHGFGHDSEAPVRLELERHASGITLRYSDSAPAYDPTANPQQTASADKAGGLG